VRLVGERDEAVTAIERGRHIVFRIDYHGKGPDRRVKRPAHGVYQERFTETSTLVSLVHRETADPYRWDRGVTRQPFRDIRRKIRQGNAAGGHRIVAGKAATRSFNSNEAIRDSPPDVLSNLRLKIAVKSLIAARKRLAVMGVR
jgi:hypothetical protein